MSKNWLHTWAIMNNQGRFIWTNDDGAPSWEFPNANGQVMIIPTGTTPVFRCVEHFNKILAVTADHICSSEDLSAELPITFTISAQPDVPRNLTWSFDSHVEITEFTLVITGVDAKGNVITDTITEVDGWSGSTAQAYATVTSIVLPERGGTGAGDTMDIGIGPNLGLANDLDSDTDIYKVVKSTAAGNATDYTGAGNIGGDDTFDTVNVSAGAAITAGDSYTIYYKTKITKLLT